MSWYAILADVTVAVHFAYVAFVILGQLAILIGWPLGWSWIRKPWFRIVHLIMILIVVVESLPFIQYECPLTTWEDALREMAGQASAKDAGFIGGFLHSIMYYQVSSQVLEVIYCLFGAVVLASFFLVPPRFRSSRAPEPTSDMATALK